MKKTAQLFPDLPLKERLIIASERDIALNTLPGSRIQRVVKDAGSSNISSIRYHYGDMEKLQEAVFYYRYKAINYYADIIMQRWSAEVRDKTTVQHYLFAIFAPRCLVMYHTLPAAYYCGCAEQMEILNPKRMSSQDRYPWFTPLRNAFSDLFVLLSQLLDADTALNRMQLVAPLTAGTLTRQEALLRAACEAADGIPTTAADQLLSFLEELVESLAASLLRELYQPVQTDFQSVFEDLLAIPPEWFIDKD